jgi:hypothetical protein
MFTTDQAYGLSTDEAALRLKKFGHNELPQADARGVIRIVLDDDFDFIVAAIGLGRRIFANLRKAMAYIMAIHIPIAGLALLPLMFGMPPILFPVHIVFLEMFIDPVCSIVFEAEPEEADAMRAAPRIQDQPMFSGARLYLNLAQGAVVLAAAFAAYVFATRTLADANAARAGVRHAGAAQFGAVDSDNRDRRYFDRVTDVRVHADAISVCIAARDVVIGGGCYRNDGHTVVRHFKSDRSIAIAALICLRARSQFVGAQRPSRLGERATRRNSVCKAFLLVRAVALAAIGKEATETRLRLAHALLCHAFLESSCKRHSGEHRGADRLGIGDANENRDVGRFEYFEIRAG